MSSPLSLSERLVALEEVATKSPDARISTFLDQFRDYLQDGVSQRGLITRDALLSPEGRVESSASPDLMRRVCLALVDLNHVVVDNDAPKGERKANVFERLKRCQCPIEVYQDMVQNPEFIRLLNRTTIEFVVMPQLPSIQAALSTKAALGDDKSARLLFELARIMEVQGQDEIRRQYAAMDEESMLRLMREEAEKTLGFIAEFRGEDLQPPPPPDNQQTEDVGALRTTVIGPEAFQARGKT